MIASLVAYLDDAAVEVDRAQSPRHSPSTTPPPCPRGDRGRPGRTVLRTGYHHRQGRRLSRIAQVQSIDGVRIGYRTTGTGGTA